MSKIRILSEHLANQIAAGEVIERPASVVKELLENSIDAEAEQIRIEVEGNGTRLIKVIDDGTGMDADDVLLCLERHATSKLHAGGEQTGRLASIRSLGFRGEALPSIASVAKMVLTSRTGNESLGTQVEVRYGKILKIHETGSNKGTVVEIRDLFGNVPARKKFLKSGRTELFHIEEVIKNYALANSGLGLTYRVNEKTPLSFSARTDSLEDRVRILFGLDQTVPLISLNEQNKTPAGPEEVSVRGFLLSPEHSFGTTARLRLFVNGRAVKDRIMAHAVAQGLAGFLMKGRSAAGAVFINLPYEKVDVNVHPAKHEIRFQQPNLIQEKIMAAVRHGMDNHQQKVRRAIFGQNLVIGKKENQKSFGEETPLNRAPRKSKTWKSLPGMLNRQNYEPQTNFASTKSEESLFPAAAENRKSVSTAEPAASFFQAHAEEIPIPESLEPIGQFMDLYLLCEARKDSDRYLVVIDQHAVHERILFENLKKQFAARQMVRQSLLFPKMVELTPETAAILEKNREQLIQLGLAVEPFGGDSYVIKAVPAVISHLAPEEILTGILAEFDSPEFSRGESRRSDAATRLDDILSTMACKAAIKAGQNLNTTEMHQLLKLMRESSVFTHCPHGRPVVRMFSSEEIKKWFHRT